MSAVLRSIHRYLGLLLALPLLVQGLSGAILAFEPMIHEEDIVPTTAGASHGAAPISIDTIVAAARSVAPNGTHETRFLPPVPGGLTTVWFAPSTASQRRGAILIRIDPETLTPVLPPESVEGRLDWVRRLHTDFLLSEFGGRTIVGWVGVGLLLLSIIGIPVWWPAPGQWRLGFTFTTGALLGFPQTVRAALGISPPGRAMPPGDNADRRRSLSENTGSAHRLDAAMALAAAAAPGTTARMMFLSPNGAPIRISMAPPGTEGVARTVIVTVDGNGVRVLNVQGPETLSAAERGLRWAHDIHFGQGLGVFWRLLTIATGLALPVFAVTGTAMWLLRKRIRRRAGFARRDALSSGA